MPLLELAGGLAFLAGASVQYAGYDRLLRPGLHSAEPGARRRALRRWAVFLVLWQLLVLIAIAIYAIALPAGQRVGYAWVAPPLGLVLGTALPLQLAVIALTRAAARG